MIAGTSVLSRPAEEFDNDVSCKWKTRNKWIYKGNNHNNSLFLALCRSNVGNESHGACWSLF